MRDYRVSLTIDGQEIDVFDEVDLELDMLSAGSAWTTSLWFSKEKRSTWKILQTIAKEGARARFSIDGAVQVDGTIEIRETHEDRSGAKMVLSGRDLAGILMDNDADPRLSFKGLTLSDLFDQYLKPLGISAHLLSGSASAEIRAVPHRAGRVRQTSRRAHHYSHHVTRKIHIDRFRARIGESVWQVLDRACRRSGYLLWVAPWPNEAPTGIGLVVDVPVNTGDPVYAFLRRELPDGSWDGHIISARHTVNGRDLPTEVTAFAHSDINSASDARMRYLLLSAVREEKWSVSVIGGSFIKQAFVHSSDTHTISGAQRAAERLLAHANERYRVYECTVRGFANGDKENEPLYTPNRLAYVRDELHGIDEKMLVTSVSFHRSRASGDLSKIKMLPFGAIQIIPEPEAK